GNRRKPTGGLVGGQQANQSGSAAHDRQRDEEGVFAPNEVADTSEEQSAERAHHKSDSEGSEIGDVREGGVAGWIEHGREENGKAAENVKVIPLDHGANGGGKNYAPDAVLGR